MNEQQDELAGLVFIALTAAAELGESNRNVVAHGIATALLNDGWRRDGC